MPDIGRGGKRRLVFRLEVHERGLCRLPNMRSGPASAQERSGLRGRNAPPGVLSLARGVLRYRDSRSAVTSATALMP